MLDILKKMILKLLIKNLIMKKSNKYRTNILKEFNDVITMKKLNELHP